MNIPFVADVEQTTTFLLERTPVFCSRETRDTRVFTFVHILSALLLEGVPKFVLTTTFIGSERESTSNLGN